MIQQTALPFKFEATSSGGATALAGLPLYLELARVLDLRRLVEEHLGAPSETVGWRDADFVMAIVLLNLAGGDCVADLELLKRDEGFMKLTRALATVGLQRRERRAKERQLAKQGSVAMPSASTVFRFLESFHGADQDVVREEGKAAIVPEHARLTGLWNVNAGLLAFMQRHRPLTTVTLDVDATLVATQKSEALYCYKKYKAYQPLNFYLADTGMVVYSHFRDGNVPCGYQQLDAFKRALALLPAGVKSVMVRMDTQGYEWELLRYLAEGKNERFGVIEFAVGADMTQELKKEVAKLRADQWKDLARRPGEVAQQWAEVPFVPNAASTKKDGPQYRFVVTREVLADQPLPGLEQETEKPFPTMEFAGKGRCKLHAIVTNGKRTGPELISWYRKRCGKSEEAHSVMKSDLAGGKLPSGVFGANAAWWTLMQLSLNLNELFKRLAMPAGWAQRRLKALRAHVICVAGRVVEHARRLVIRLGSEHGVAEFIQGIRERILALEVPSTS